MTTQAERRRQIGADNKSARQASGRVMRDDLRALSAPPTAMEQLPVLPKKGGVEATRGVADYKGGSGDTAGIASPLTEQHFSTREYWETGIPSSDGLFMFPAPKKIKMTDANDAEVIFEYAEPLIPEPEE